MGVISIMGPRARDLLQSLTPADLSHASFPFATSREIEMGFGHVRASRITFVGELGWELYIPTELMQHLYDLIAAAGESYQLVHAGYHALNSLRLEKAYRHWSHDITDEDTPLEAGLGFVVKFDKPGGFIGREALIDQQERGLSRHLVQLRLKDSEPLIYHNEPIWRDGEIVGHITSGAYGHTLGGAIGLGYVTAEPGSAAESVLAASYEVEVACERVAAEVSLQPLYDPENTQIRR
jgi:4-methylaminobutanoate oxidase (formaldehyde-forming)